MAYDVDAADLTDRYDARDIGDLASDTGTAIVEGDLAANPKVVAAINDALGDIESALVAGARYTVTQLEGLAGVALAKFKRLACGRAMFYLLSRRPAQNPDKLKQFDEWTEDQLERLRVGENIFNLDEQKDAGVIDHQFMSAVDASNLPTIRNRVRNTYPARPTFPCD